MQFAITSIRLFLYIALLPMLIPICIMLSLVSLLMGFFIWITEGDDDAFDFGMFAAVFPFKKLVDIIEDLIYDYRNIWS